MVAVVGPDGVDATIDRLSRAGVPAWVLGTVTADDGSRDDVVRGTKGVHGGAVRMRGDYRTT